MIFTIDPKIGANFLEFGISSGRVHDLLKEGYTSFKRTPAAKFPCDYYQDVGLFIYYDKLHLMEAIEFTYPAKVKLFEHKLFELSYDEIKTILLNYDKNLEIELDGLTSYQLGVGVYAPSAMRNKNSKVESIIIFNEYYYASNE